MPTNNLKKCHLMMGVTVITLFGQQKTVFGVDGNLIKPKSNSAESDSKTAVDKRDRRWWSSFNPKNIINKWRKQKNEGPDGDAQMKKDDVSEGPDGDTAKSNTGATAGKSDKKIEPRRRWWSSFNPKNIINKLRNQMKKDDVNEGVADGDDQSTNKEPTREETIKKLKSLKCVNGRRGVARVATKVAFTVITKIGGSVTGGILGGAATGALGGPWGMAAGAASGVIGGLLSGVTLGILEGVNETRRIGKHNAFVKEVKAKIDGVDVTLRQTEETDPDGCGGKVKSVEMVIDDKKPSVGETSANGAGETSPNGAGETSANGAGETSANGAGELTTPAETQKTKQKSIPLLAQKPEKTPETTQPTRRTEKTPETATRRRYFPKTREFLSRVKKSVKERVKSVSNKAKKVAKKVFEGVVLTLGQIGGYLLNPVTHPHLAKLAEYGGSFVTALGITESSQMLHKRIFQTKKLLGIGDKALKTAANAANTFTNGARVLAAGVGGMAVGTVVGMVLSSMANGLYKKCFKPFPDVDALRKELQSVTPEEGVEPDAEEEKNIPTVDVKVDETQKDDDEVTKDGAASEVTKNDA